MDEPTLVKETESAGGPVAAPKRGETARQQIRKATVYYKWLKKFMEAGRRRLRGDIQREAGREEVASLKEESARLKQLVAEYALDLMALKGSLLAER